MGRRRGLAASGEDGEATVKAQYRGQLAGCPQRADERDVPFF